MDDRGRTVLTRLTISNLATIASLTIEIGGGFTVLTGETGAGKSILIDAIRFVLGEKTAPHQVRGGARQTLVEAVFDIGALPDVRARLNDLDIPFDNELTLRRLLQENGRSRALANDCAITQGRLEVLGRYLVNIHGQHDNQMLLDAATHIDFLDAYAGLMDRRAEVAQLHVDYIRTLAKRKAAHHQAGERVARGEELAEMLEELKAANLASGEEEQLQREHTVLTHTDQLAGLLYTVCERLYEGEGPIVARLAELGGLLEQAASLDERLAPHSAQLTPLRYQLEDLHQALRAHAAGLEADPNRLDAVNARLAELEKIKRKYGGSIEGALAAMGEAEAELTGLEEAGEGQEVLERRLNELAAQLHAKSEELSRNRKKAAIRLDRSIEAQLGELGIKQAAYETRITPLASDAAKTPAYSPAGMDKVEFQLSTNSGQPARPLSRIASGGELSRTMLALKTILTEADPTRTLIFDEVDSGISGQIAEIVGRKLRGLGASHQVLCVTHLPQIAALGDTHVLVTKQHQDGQTYTRAEPLGGKEKVQEVARLLSGIDITRHSLASAEEMVNRGRQAGA